MSARRFLPWAVAAVLLAGTALLTAAPKKPVYIGARACGQCHEGTAMGHQYSRWLNTKHAKAWAVLSMPESVEISRISGLREPPQRSPVCLGCHAVAADTEAWERDDSFRIEDGMQCEGCHGPGSEYAQEAVMKDKAAAMKAGLRFPVERDCMVCHVEKGSHVAVLKELKFDFDKFWKQIAHTAPQTGRVQGSVPVTKAATAKGAKFVGSYGCAKCHEAAEKGYQYSRWRMSPHARAWAVLATPAGYAAAAKQGIKGDPQKAEACLKCHSNGGGPATETFQLDEGVGCEACHGPGSEYSAEAVMRDRASAVGAGLVKPDAKTCARCHTNPKFDFAAKFKLIAHPATEPQVAREPRYLSPLRLAVRPGGKELYVTFEAGDAVGVVDIATRRKIAEIPAGARTTGVTFSPDGKFAYVSNRQDDTVSVIDADERSVVRTIKAGNEPHGLLTDRAGRFLYVLNTSSNDIYVFDTNTWERVRSATAGRGPWSGAISPDGQTMLVSNTYTRLVPFRAPLVSEVTVLDMGRGTVEDRWAIPGSNLMTGIAWHPSGEFALAVMNRTKNLVPMTRLLQGWTITNSVAILWRDGRVNELLLDEPNAGFADPVDVAFTRDGTHALVTSSGTNRVAVIDIARMEGILKRATPEELEHVLPNHLGKAAEYIPKYIPTGDSPRGIAVTPDGSAAFVANAIDDSLTVIDMAKLEAAGRIDLGGPDSVTKTRYGERLFHNAKISFHRQFSCHSCHPDGHVDGITYDIEADGLGISPVDNRTLRGILDTAPFKWEGTNPSLSRQCGARLAVFFTRQLPFSPDELAAVDRYVTTIQRPPNRYRPLWAPLTPAQQRGRDIFQRTRTNDGREVPRELRCINCHPAPYFTDRQRHDVGSRHPSDRQGRFDTPHLLNIYDSAPYMHNGIAHTLEEIWTLYNPYDKHGITNDLTKDQLNDLIEYLKTL